MAQMAADHPEFPVIKLKLGSDDDISRVAAVRNARPDVRLYLDANAGWKPDEAVRLIKDLKPLEIDMIEQPVAGNDIEGMGYVQSQTDIPIVADESLKSLETLEELARVGVQGINFKDYEAGWAETDAEIVKKRKGTWTQDHVGLYDGNISGSYGYVALGCLG